MSLTNPEKVITEQRLSEFYTQILPYLGGMPEALANKFDKANLYSTDEKIVGCWIDGKPLYQRVLVETNITATGSTEFYLSDANKIANCGNYFIVSALGYSSDWSGCGEAMGNDYATPINQYMFVITAYSPTNGRCWLLRGANGWSNVIIVIRYTKTTDQPNSFNIGSDTDYSTSEKIVGTWIDGKPLYQKVINGLSVSVSQSTSSTDAWKTITNISDIDKMISARYYSGSGNDFVEVKASETNGNKAHMFLSSRTITCAIIQYTKTTD